MKPTDRLPASIDRARALTHEAPADEITADRIQHAMVLMAFLVASGQPRLVPLLDRLEAELALYKQERDPVSRARRILLDHTASLDGTGKAIR